MLFPGQGILFPGQGILFPGQGILFPGTREKPPSEIRNNKSANIR